MAPPWTEKEIFLLKSTYNELSWAKIIPLFPGRARESIAHKARALKLRRPELSIAIELPLIAPVELAYLAGFFDGEGNITIARLSHKGKYGRNLYYTLMVRCSNNCQVPLKCFKEFFGGSLKERIARPNCLPHYIWCAQARWAAATLKVLMPYLKIKQHQAEIALEFQKRLRPTGKRTRFISEPLSEAELVIRERMREELRAATKAFNNRNREAKEFVRSL